MTEQIDPETGEVIAEPEGPVSFNTTVPASIDELMSQDFATWFLSIKPSLDSIYAAVAAYRGDGETAPDVGTIRNSMRVFAGFLAYLPKELACAETYASMKENAFFESPAAKDLTPTIAKKRAEAYAHKEIMVRNWIAELNKSLGKILDSVRSSLSFEKELLREHEF